MRRTTVAALLLSLLALLGACGESEPASKAPPGSPENPLQSQARHDGTDPDAPRGGKPNYRSLVDRQSGDPAERSSPCAFVTKRQAQEIVGSSLLDPVEAPQGPTCIYRDRGGKTFITVALQDEGFGALRDDVRRLRRVSVADRRAYCGVYGSPMLFLPLDGGRVLSVTAQCEVAMQFARSAVPRLDG
jgi:hypothetical protein